MASTIRDEIETSIRRMMTLRESFHRKSPPQIASANRSTSCDGITASLWRRDCTENGCTRELRMRPTKSARFCLVKTGWHTSKRRIGQYFIVVVTLIHVPRHTYKQRRSSAGIPLEPKIRGRAYGRPDGASGSISDGAAEVQFVPGVRFGKPLDGAGNSASGALLAQLKLPG